MYLTHLSLTNFRSFARLDIEVPRRIILLVGGNAQGKTSILEAVYYLTAFTSLHTPSDRQLINFLAAQEKLAVARVVAEYQRNSKSHHLEVRLIQETNGDTGYSRFRKEILLDGIKCSQTEAIGHFNAVIFLPQMSRIIEDGPEERRRYLNLTISPINPAYAQALTEYNQALSQRNALLKMLNERGGDIEQLTYWDEILVQRGALLIHARIQAILELEKLAARIHLNLTHSKEILRLVYQPAFDPLAQPAGQIALPLDISLDRSGLPVEQIAEGFTKRLFELRREEIQRGVTTIGPHRDEMRLLCNGIDLGDFGSRGQTRTAILSLKMAEVAWIKEKTGQTPVLLLDEIMAELDIQRRKDLLEYIQENEQAILTTTDAGLFKEEFLENATLWHLNSGNISKNH